MPPSSARIRVLAWVKGLQDWQSGGHEWHVRSSRYMNEGAVSGPAIALPGLPGPSGIGTSASRLPVLSPASLGQ